MAISISGNYINNAGNNANSAISQSDVRHASTQGSEVKSASSQGGHLAVSSLRQGQTISGEVVSKDGNTVTLKLSDGQLLNAQVSGDNNLVLGKLLSFEVHGNEAGKIALRPLYANLNSSSTINVALRAAGMPQTASTVSMTSAMMDAGMSIDRNSLQEMSRSVNAYPLADPASIVQMTKLGLPIDELTVTQYENYKNFEHQVINEITELTSGLSDAITESIIAGSDSDIQNVFNLFNEIDTNLLREEESFTEQELLTSDELDSVNSESVVNNEVAKSSPFAAFRNAADMLLDAIRGNDSSVKVDGIVSDTPEIVSEEAESFLDKGDVQFNNNQNDTHSIIKNLSALIGQEISDTPKASELTDFIKNIINTVATDKMNPEYKDIIKSELSKLIQKDDVKEVLKDAIKSQMLLTPDKISKEGSVNELFSRIIKMTKAATDFSSATNSPEAQNIAQNAQNIQNNVNFMNQLNEFVNYVQLPLKMYEENAHGELYVYSKHKSLEETDGNISALLHLDMDHLGPMDVYVSMKNYTNVSTNFRLADAKTLDFIAENIHLLNEKLEQKGYSMTTNFTTGGSITGEDKPITDEFFKDSFEDEGMKVISKLQFDVRA